MTALADRSRASSAAAPAPLRVLSLTKATGGLAQFNRVLMAELAALGVESRTLCLSDNGEEYAAVLRRDGLDAEALPMARYRIDPAGDARTFARIVAATRRHRPSVVVGHGSKPGALARAAGRVAGAPSVYAQHSLAFLRRTQGRMAPAYWALERLARGFGGHVVALSRSNLDRTIAYGLATPAAASVIHTGIDTTRFRRDGRRDETLAGLGLDPALPVVGWLGRFERQKAPGDFAAALAILARDGAMFQGLVAGEGSRRDAFVAAVAAAGLGDRVRVLPWQSDTPRLLSAIDIFALSSLWEGLPITLLEAMACGAAPVATAVDGSVEAVEDGVSGFLTPPGDPVALAAAIGSLLADPARRATMARAARARVETAFDKRRMAEEWRALLAAVAAAGARR